MFKHVILPILVLLGGISIGYYFLNVPPAVRERPSGEKQATPVETMAAMRDTYRAAVNAVGQVEPAMRTALKARVNGTVVYMAPNFIPGGHVKKGDVLLRLSKRAKVQRVAIAEASLTQAKADGAIEKGRAAIARKDLSILKASGASPRDSSLTLRKPQEAIAAAAVARAEADLALARLEIERTEITAPYDALIADRNVALGDVIASSQTVLADLIGTERYWVRATAPVKSLAYMDDKTATVRIVADNKRGERAGRLLHVIGTLDARARMADILIEVSDPVASPALLVNDFVSVTIDGTPLKDVIRVPASLFGSRNELLTVKDGVLRTLAVNPVYRDRDDVYLSEALEDGARIIVTDLAVVENGMKVTDVTTKQQISASEKVNKPKKNRKDASNP